LSDLEEDKKLIEEVEGERKKRKEI